MSGLMEDKHFIKRELFFLLCVCDLTLLGIVRFWVTELVVILTPIIAFFVAIAFSTPYARPLSSTTFFSDFTEFCFLTLNAFCFFLLYFFVVSRKNWTMCVE